MFQHTEEAKMVDHKQKEETQALETLSTRSLLTYYNLLNQNKYKTHKKVKRFYKISTNQVYLFDLRDWY